MVDSASVNMLPEQKEYKKWFNEKVRPHKGSLQIGFQFLPRSENVQRGEATHELALITNRNYKLTSKGDTTVAGRIFSHIERVLHNRLVTSPVPDTETPYLVNDMPLHNGLFGTPPLAAGFDSTFPEPSRVSALEYVITKVVAHWVVTDQSPLYRVQ